MDMITQHILARAACSFTQSNNMKQIMLLLSLAFVGVYAGHSAPVQPSMQRDWNFPTANGPVTVRVSAVPSRQDGKSVYTLQIISGRAEPSVIDEAAFLRSVTKSMESEGMQPTRIVALHLELCEPDVSNQLSRAAYESTEWRGANTSNAGFVVVKLLNSIGAYEPFNRVFSQYGLALKVSNAEYISTKSPEQLGLKRNGVSSLPTRATLEIVLRHMSPS
jgi:hypothetical protein